MNFQRKLVILLSVISMVFILISGCTYITPTPDDDYDYDSYTVSYIRVSPSSATMNVNTSKIFKVLAYDSEDNLIPVDPSGVEWLASYQCVVCGKVWELNPESGSISTYFIPKKIGKYYIFAHYKEKWDYSPIDAE